MAISLSKDTFDPGKAGDRAVDVLSRLQDMQLARRLGKMLLLAAAIALGLTVFFWSQRPGHVPLYAGLDAKATAEATDLLRAAEIPFRIDQGTGAISVPEDRLHDARLRLAGSGLTESGRLGFELMERDPGFGVSQFVETARYQHALETELVRTITALRPVRDARVHLAIPKPSAFTRQREAASASVVLELRGGASLERGQVDAIVHLVASSIPDLAPARVTVVDQGGRLLSNDSQDPAATLSSVQFEQVRRQETSFNQRIRELLEPMTGAGRVSAEVTIDMDFSVSEEARELYNAEPPKLRSEQTSENSVAVAGPAGIPGVTSNLPESAADPDAAAAGGAAPVATAGTTATPSEGTRSATRNYELDRTLQHTRQPPGRIRRVTAAVLVDHVPRTGTDGAVALQPLTEAELQRVDALVRQAVGFDQARGDTVSVMNAPFIREEAGDGPATPWWQLPQLREVARLLAGALVVLALLFGVVRPAVRQITSPDTKRRLPAAAVTDVEVVADARGLADDSARISARAPIALASDAYEDQVRQAREAVRDDSKRVAQVVKGWLSDEAGA